MRIPSKFGCDTCGKEREIGRGAIGWFMIGVVVGSETPPDTELGGQFCSKDCLRIGLPLMQLPEELPTPRLLSPVQDVVTDIATPRPGQYL